MFEITAENAQVVFDCMVKSVETAASVRLEAQRHGTEDEFEKADASFQAICQMMAQAIALGATAA